MKKEDLYEKSILLIGPAGAGKSSVAEELSKDTGLKRFSVDSITRNDGPSGFISRFETTDDYNLAMTKALVERAEVGNVSGIVDFGAGHTIYDDTEKFEQAKKIFSKFKNVILLLPSCNNTEALEILSKRAVGDTSLNDKAVNGRCNRELANMVIYENGRNPEKIAKDILRYIENRDKDLKDLGRE